MYLFCSVCTVLTCAFFILWFYFKFKPNYWRRLNIKYLPSVPIFGNVTKSMLLLNSLQETYQELYEVASKEPYVGYYEMNIPTLFVKDPQLITSIMVKDFKHFTNRGRPFIFTKNRKLNALSLHLGTAEDGRWKFLRHRMTTVFSSGKIKLMHDQLADSINIINDHLNRLMKGQKSTDIELKDLFEKLTMHVITSFVFGAESTSITSSDEFQQMMNETIQPSLMKTWHKLLAAYCPTWLNDIVNRAEVNDEVLHYFKRLALDSVEYRRSHGIKGRDILQLLMDLQNSHVDPKFAVCDDNRALLPLEKFDEVDIMANSFVFLFGGFETTSSTLSFCAYELALNEKIQQNLRQEVQNVKDEYGTLNYDSLKKLNYLEAVIAETLRKYPVTLAASRECCEDYNIPGTEICLPKGTNIKIPTWSLHHDSKYYPNPEKFDPERFLGHNKYSIQNGTYLAFGDGPRSCIGRRFAEVELKAAVADLILNYDIKPCAKTEIPVKFKRGSNMLLCENGIWVNMTRRNTTI